MGVKKKYSVGDYVMLMRDHPDDNAELFTGDIGVVVVDDKSRCGVNWFKPIGHDCSGRLEGDERKFGWFVEYSDIAPYEAGREIEPPSPEELPDISELF